MTLPHRYTCHHCLRLPLTWEDRSVSTKNREEKSIRPSSLSAHTTHWRFPCGACARMHVSWDDATVPQVRIWLHSCWRFGESWQMDGNTSSSPPAWMILCPHILSTQVRLLSQIYSVQDTLQSGLQFRRSKMLHIRRETSDHSEALGKPVVPRLRTTAQTRSMRHQEAMVTCCSRGLTKGQKRARKQHAGPPLSPKEE